MKAMGFVGEALEFEHVCLIKNQESRKGCKGAVVQTDKKGRTCDCV